MSGEKCAIVTGAGSGLGRAAAIKLASENVRVCLIDLKENRAEKVREEIEKNGGEAFVQDIDVSDPERVRASVDAVIERWGRIDILYNNAGINGEVAPIEELTYEDWNKTLSTNLTSTFLFVHHCIPHMKKNGGSIIVTSSINGNRTFSNIGMSAYSTSKAGQVAFVKMAALELARYHIRVNAICPGAIETNIGQNTFKDDDLDKVDIPVEYPEGGEHPLEGKSGSAEQVADLVWFLASDKASHITGTEVYVDGGESLLR